LEGYLLDKSLREMIHALTVVRIVRKEQRNVCGACGVLPKTVQAYLDEYRAEQTLRRDCATLWRAGILERVGGSGARRGYRVAS
jgi:hypothetical protein